MRLGEHLQVCLFIDAVVLMDNEDLLCAPFANLEVVLGRQLLSGRTHAARRRCWCVVELLAVVNFFGDRRALFVLGCRRK